MNVAAGRDVVIVLRNLFAAHDAAELVFFAPGFEGLGNAQDGVVGNVVLGVALLEFAAGVRVSVDVGISVNVDIIVLVGFGDKAVGETVGGGYSPQAKAIATSMISRTPFFFVVHIFCSFWSKQSAG